MTSKTEGIDLTMEDIGQALMDSFKRGAEWVKKAEADDRIVTDHMGTHSAAHEAADQFMSRLIREAYYRRHKNEQA